MADDRPRDWSPLVEDGSDPIPGDWELVQEAAARYRETADAIQRAQTLLRDVTDSDEGWQSEGGDAFREKATELSDDVFKAYGRYDAVADALAEYWPELKEAQEDSLDLRTQAITAQDEIDGLNRQVEAAEDEDSDTHGNLSVLQGDLDLAQGELQRLRDRLAEIIEDKDAAAQRAADAIGEFIGSDGLKDGFWDRMGAAWDAFQDVMAIVGEIAGQIAMYAGLASLALCWVPVLGQALATVATIATVVSLVANGVNGDWNAFMVDAIGMLTFGVGRFAGAAARTIRTRALRSIDEAADRGMAAIRNSNLPYPERVRLFTQHSGLPPSAATGARRQIRESADLVSGPTADLRRTLPDMGQSLREGFNPSNWRRAGNWQEAMGLTDSRFTDIAGMSTPARWAGGGEVASWAAGTATTLWTRDSVAGIQMSTPIQIHPSDGWSMDWNLPFSDTPGASISIEPVDVGEFSNRDSEAPVQ